MLYIRMTPEDNCLVLSVAMVLGIEPHKLYSDLRSKGVKWDEPTFDGEYRGIHSEEIQDILFEKYDYYMYTVDRYPQLGYDTYDTITVLQENPNARMRMYMTYNDGILITINHAMAYEHTTNKVYDSVKGIYDCTDMILDQVQMFLGIVKAS